MSRRDIIASDMFSRDLIICLRSCPPSPPPRPRRALSVSWGPSGRVKKKAPDSQAPQALTAGVPGAMGAAGPQEPSRLWPGNPRPIPRGAMGAPGGPWTSRESPEGPLGTPRGPLGSPREFWGPSGSAGGLPYPLPYHLPRHLSRPRGWGSEGPRVLLGVFSHAP